jgi:hypothetical protein
MRLLSTLGGSMNHRAHVTLRLLTGIGIGIPSAAADVQGVAASIPSLPDASGRPATQDRPALPGIYALVSIDGHKLPHAPMHPGRPADAPPPPVVVGSIFTIKGDSTFQQTMSYRITQGGAERVVDGQFSGTYLPEGTGYVFTWTNAGRTPVMLRGDTLVLNNAGMVFTYYRQRRP